MNIVVDKNNIELLEKELKEWFKKNPVSSIYNEYPEQQKLINQAKARGEKPDMFLVGRSNGGWFVEPTIEIRDMPEPLGKLIAITYPGVSNMPFMICCNENPQVIMNDNGILVQYTSSLLRKLVHTKIKAESSNKKNEAITHHKWEDLMWEGYNSYDV